MLVRLAYGRHGLDVEVPDGATVVRPAEPAALDDEEGAVLRALRAPLAGPPLDRLVAAGGSVAVVFPDATRPMPNRAVLSPLLAELERLGAGPERVALLCATGTHQPAPESELAEMLGDEVAGRYRVHQHRADDDRHVMVGRVDGTPVLLDRRYVSSHVRLCVGLVEPHFFAGFSGGPKGVCPGLAATETVLAAHSPQRIADPLATFLRTEGNPVHDFVRAATALDPPQLSVDVTVNRRRQLTSVRAAPLPDGHADACRFVTATAVRPVGRRFDVVVTTNGGHPLDRNLYQSVKGMAAAERLVRPGGTIVMAAACGDGTPTGGAFDGHLRAAGSAAELAGDGGEPSPDRWQAQVLGRVLGRAAVWLYAGGLDDAEVRRAHLRPVGDVSAAVADAVAAAGPGATVAVLPDGPATVADGDLPI
ncbi:MAG: nickel-dependent lactate racemase family protein [Acidimicrobiales bacterium]